MDAVARATERKMTVEKCKGCEAFPKCTAESYGNATCRYLRFTYGMDDRVETTNADRIRAMSDDELAKFLDDCNSQGCVCPTRDCSPTCHQCIVKWLQQPTEEG